MEEGASSFGINGHTGEITDMRALGVWEPLAVKVQTMKTAVESAVRGISPIFTWFCTGAYFRGWNVGRQCVDWVVVPAVAPQCGLCVASDESALDLFFVCSL